MIYSKPTSEDLLTYSTVKIDGCSEAKLGFDFLSEQPSISKRRYCNKVLVHECVSVPQTEPLEITKAVFLATADPCYNDLAFSKTSDGEDATIELQLDEDNKTIGVIITFHSDETCDMPPLMAYKLYAYIDTERVLLSRGNLCISPCCCSDSYDEIW